MIRAARTVEVAPVLQRYMVDLAEATRRHPATSVGVSPRGTLALQRVVRARAATFGRSYSVPDDIKALAHTVLAHRLILSPEARVSGTTAAAVVSEVLGQVPVPTSRDASLGA